MTLVDRTTLRTPEGVVYGLPVAGLGSRFIGAAIDGSLQVVVFAFFQGVNDGEVGSAISVIFGFVVVFGYQFLCEAFFTGRTIGKRLAGIRVVSVAGGSLTVQQAAVRNLVRIADFLPFMYAVGILSVLSTSRSQRIGDVAAGTFVVVEPSKKRVKRRLKKRLKREAGAPVSGFGVPMAAPTIVLNEAARAELQMWDVVQISRDEVGIVRQFLARREGLDLVTRERIANSYAAKLRPRVHGVHQSISNERFLELLVEAKQSRR